MIGDPLPEDIGIILPNEYASGWYVFWQEILGPKRLALGFVPSVPTAGKSMDEDNTVGMLVLELSTFYHVRPMHRSNDLLHSGVDGLVYSIQAWSFRKSYEAGRNLSCCAFITKIA